VLSSTISGIQIWTLVLAGLAVVASIAGTFVSAHLSARSEHDIWQRDLRIQLYAELASTAEAFIDLLMKYPPATFEEKLIANSNLLRKLADVETYGSKDVRKAAKAMFDALAINLPGDSFESRSEAEDSLTAYRSAVRSSLEIDDD
jgi:hypothetical protein